MLELAVLIPGTLLAIPAYERAFKNKNGRIDGNLAVNTPYALHSGRTVLLFV